MKRYGIIIYETILIIFYLLTSKKKNTSDRMLKAVKAMPLAFQFNAPGSGLAEPTVTAQDSGFQVDPMSAELLQTSTIVRSYFPETWIWELIPTRYNK